MTDDRGDRAGPGPSDLRRSVLTCGVTNGKGAADAYRRASGRGTRRPHAGRILARAWVDVIWRCWQDGVPYDPAKHQAL